MAKNFLGDFLSLFDSNLTNAAFGEAIETDLDLLESKGENTGSFYGKVIF